MLVSTRNWMFLAVNTLVLVGFTGTAHAGPQEDERARNAIRVIKEIQRIPEQSIPDKLLDEAKAVVVIPDTIKAGLVIGGRRGHGVMSVKTSEGTWSNPTFIKLTGASIGFQAGVQSSDVVLVFRNDRNLNNIVNGKFTLGADASVAAGPVGRQAAAATDGQLRAEIWSWSRARGLFAGVALDGAVLQIDDFANVMSYGPNATPRMIFESRTSQPSADITAFRDQLEEATAMARDARGTSSINNQQPVPYQQQQTYQQAPVYQTATAPEPVYQAPPVEVQSQGFQNVETAPVYSEPLKDNP